MDIRAAVLLTVWIAVPSMAAPAAGWPSNLTCEEIDSQLCDETPHCNITKPKYPSNYAFDLSSNIYSVANMVDGQNFPNLSGQISGQHERLQNADYRQLIFMLDTEQLVTVSPERDDRYRAVPGRFRAVVQYGNPGGSSTHWLRCASKAGGS
jgi:hypothetical protein